jgi:hypothetical protein
MSKGRVIAGTTVALALLCVAGYAYLSPPFAATCKSTYAEGSAWVRRQAGAIEQAYKKTDLYASVNRELRQRESVSQQKKRSAVSPKAATSEALAKARADAQAKKQKPLSEAARRQQERASWSPGQRIAHGSSFAKHKGDFGFTAEDQMASHVDRVIGFASASNTKQLSGGQTAYWDEKTWSIVIVDPKSPDGGTAFKPKQGRPYFVNLK